MHLALAIPLALATTLTWLDPAQVVPRQTGVCITEWSGGQRVEIPIEIVGVLDAPAPERTAVLVRLLDDRLAGTGVVAGMSGSPVYVDGKLLGALAFGWSFAKEPLGGVTPFATMRSLEGGADAAPAPVPKLTEVADLAAGKLAPTAVLPHLPAASDAGVRPIAVGGLPLPTGFGQELLASMGWQAVPAGGTAAVSGTPEAGDMIAALLVWGDATIAAGGTATARDGDRVWAFGHPLFGLGGVKLPAARARVLAIQTSYQSSFKMFAVGEPFGTFLADRPAGMLAVAGAPPAGLPVTVEVKEPLGERTWHFHVANVPLLEPLLVTYVTNACLTARGAASGEASTRLLLTVDLADGRSLTMDQDLRGVDALARVSTLVGTVVGLLDNSPYPHPTVTGVSARLERQELPTGASIATAIPERTQVRPGEELAVAVRLLPYREEPKTVTLKVRVPDTAAPGPLDLIVADGAAWSAYRVKAEAANPTDFNQLLAALAMFEPSSTLVAALESRDRGVVVDGGAQPNLPPSWAATLAIGLGRGGVDRLSTAVTATARWKAPYPLDGAFRIPLVVREQGEEAP